MTPEVFISLSGQDAQFGRHLWQLLPKGLAFFYERSFESGKLLLDEMEKGVDRASLYVLLASRASLTSPWVGFEIDEARVEKLKRPNFDILAFPIEQGLHVRDFPRWLQSRWVAGGPWNPKDISRYLLHRILDSHLSNNIQSRTVVGRGSLKDTAVQLVLDTLANTGRMPNVLIFSGVSQIGRRTFARYFMREAYPSLPNIAMGPEIILPQFADIADLYRSIREQVEAEFSAQDFESSLEAFRVLSVEEQVKEVVSSLAHFENLGQAVFVITGSGLFEDAGNPKPWLLPLLDALGEHESTFVVFISNRQLQEERLLPYDHVKQINVPELTDRDTRALMTLSSSLYRMKPVNASQQIVTAIGGHPVIAKAAVRLAAQRGPELLERNPGVLFSIQDEVLSENLDVDSLSPVQKEILCVLSWVPKLSGNLLEKTLEKRFESAEEELVAAIEDLVLGCLVQIADQSYTISRPIRAMFRRRYGYGPEGLIGAFSTVLAEAWTEAAAGGEFSTDLLDAFVFMYALEGKSLPDDLKALLLPSTLEEVIRTTYARGRDDDALLRQVVEWGSIADSMSMDETVREEILGTVIRALVRLNRRREAEELLDLFSKRGYRSTPFLRGFLLRRNNELDQAITPLKEALRLGKNLRSVVQELATCYQRLGRMQALAELVAEYDGLIQDSATLLDFKIGLLISSGDIRQAEAGIRRLSSFAQDEGRSSIRRAQILIQRDHDFPGAFKVLDELVSRGIGDTIRVRRWRAIAAAWAGEMEVANRDVQFIGSKIGREDTARRLKVHVALAANDAAAAERELSQLTSGSMQDRILQARVLELKSQDVAVPLAERERLRREAASIRAQGRGLSEYDL